MSWELHEQNGGYFLKKQGYLNLSFFFLDQVQRRLQTRIEVHGNYLQSILEKAKQLLAPQGAGLRFNDISCIDELPWQSCHVDKIYESTGSENYQSRWERDKPMAASRDIHLELIGRSVAYSESMALSKEDGQIGFCEQDDGLLHRIDAFNRSRLVTNGLSSWSFNMILRSRIGTTVNLALNVWAWRSFPPGHHGRDFHIFKGWVEGERSVHFGCPPSYPICFLVYDIDMDTSSSSNMIIWRLRRELLMKPLPQTVILCMTSNFCLLYLHQLFVNTNIHHLISRYTITSFWDRHPYQLHWWTLNMMSLGRGLIIWSFVTGISRPTWQLLAATMWCSHFS